MCSGVVFIPLPLLGFLADGFFATVFLMAATFLGSTVFLVDLGFLSLDLGLGLLVLGTLALMTLGVLDLDLAIFLLAGASDVCNYFATKNKEMGF